MKGNNDYDDLASDDNEGGHHGVSSSGSRKNGEYGGHK